MRLHALLILPFVVLHARAASIPDHIVPELEKKLSEAVKEVLDKDAIALKNDLDDQELIDRVNAVDNVVAESGPSIKTENGPSDDESVDIKRVEIDLKNPGPPQVQRHDYQNPEVFDEAKLKESSVSQSIAETQNVLHEGLIDINQKVQQPALDDEKITLVRNSINELQENFSNQLRALNEVIKKYSEPEDSSSLRTAAGPASALASTSDLKKVENEFTTEIENLSEGVAQLKADAPTPAPAGSPNIIQLIVEQVQKFQTAVQQNFANLNSAVVNALNGTQSNGDGTSSPGFFQNPFKPSQQQPQQQQQQQQPGFFPWIQGITNTVQGWFTPGQAQPATPPTSSPVAAANTEVSTQVPEKSVDVTPTASEPNQQSGAVLEVEAAGDPAEKGHGGGPGSEYSGNVNGVGLDGEAVTVENRNDVTEQPEVAEEQKGNELVDNKEEKLAEEVTLKIENSDYTAKPTEVETLEITTKLDELQKIEDPVTEIQPIISLRNQEESLEVTTNVEELQKTEEPVTEVVPIILVRSKEENIETEELKTETPTTEQPSLKEEITTILSDLMMNDGPKIEDRISSDTLIKEDDKSETTVLPVNEIENELSTEEISTTEGIKEILMRDGLLGENTPVKEIVESDVSGTEVPEIDGVSKQEESTTNIVTVKAEESIPTVVPLVDVDSRNQEVPVTEAEIKQVDEENGRTTEVTVLEEQNLNLEVLPTEEIKREENEPTTEAPKIEENKEERKEIKRKVIRRRRLIKRTLL